MGRKPLYTLRALLARRRFEEGLAEELRFHLEAHAEDLVRAGVPPAEAMRRARMELGCVDSVQEDCRQAFGLRLADEIRQDACYAWRLMRRTPGVTATAVLTLALCLGANLTLFAAVDAILLRPLPFPRPERLVRVFNTYPRAGVPDDGASIANYYERRGRIAAFSSIAELRSGSAIVGEVGATEREPVTRVTADFFATLGRGPIAGRAFLESEMTPEADGAVIVTDGFLRDRLGGDTHALGRALRIDGRSHLIVGILPSDFRYLSSRARLYLPLTSSLEQRQPSERHAGSSTEMIARLASGATLATAQALMDTHNAREERGDPERESMAQAGFRTLVVPLRGDHVAAIRPVVLLMQAGGLLLLSIGAVNLVNLLLVRSGGRLREMAVRQAIGAGRGRIVRQVLAETALLVSSGGVVGLALATAGIRLLRSLGSDHLPLGADIAVGPRVVLVGLVGLLALAGAIGTPLAWQGLRGRSGELLGGARGGSPSRAMRRLTHGFLMAQIALSFVLLSAAGLLAMSLRRANEVFPGFRPGGVLSGRITLPAASYPTGSSLVAMADRLLEALDRQPGVAVAGLMTNVPMSGNELKSAAAVEGWDLPPGESPHATYAYSVWGDALRALGVPLLEGRLLGGAGTGRDDRVAVVDEIFARRYWPRGGALGHRVFLGPRAAPTDEGFTIVGVVGALKQDGLTEGDGPGAVFYPFADRLDRTFFVVARTTVPPPTLAATLRRVVRGIDPDLPVSDIEPMEDRVAESLTARRSPALLAAVFSLLAVLLTTVGTYGVVSWGVAQRRQEIGLRLAIGANPTDVRRLLVTTGFRLLATGGAIGLAGASAAGEGMRTLLFDVPALHLGALSAAAALIAATTLTACLIPAWRAARVSPRDALSDG